ncbi:MAG: PIG-L family deacetylase [Ignavibacteria bacterium]
MKLKKSIIVFFLIIFIIPSFFNRIKSQPHEVLNAAQLKLALKKLNVLGSVLYIAAHPDDENTAVLSYFASGRLLRTGYLSITRGDGGQNLIGSEQDEILGVIRTQELLAARRLDGAEQFFTRAVDFGFSKSPKETLEIWDKQKILSDAVWVIRKFKPDVIITRFPPTGEGGHGHHTASSILAEEAFHSAADPEKFPEQLKYVKPWQAKRIYWNSWLSDQRNPDDLITIDLGSYNTLLGMSYTEISAKSRTMHKSQGFGSMGKRGETLNYFSYTAGDKANKDLLENIDLTWNRIKNGSKIGEILNKANENFQPENPSAIIPLLIDAYKEMNNLEDDYWANVKKKELLDVIRSAAGIWFEAIADDFSACPGDTLRIFSGAVNRSAFPFTLKKVEVKSSSDNLSDDYNYIKELNEPLVNGKLIQNDLLIKLPENMNYSQPYWLVEKKLKGSYQINAQNLTGLAYNDNSLTVSFTLNAEGFPVAFEEPVQFRRVDPVDGEIYRPLAVTPEVSINLEDKVYIFPDNNKKEIFVNLISNKKNTSGTLNILLPSEWKAEPGRIKFNFKNKGEEKLFGFTVYPPGKPGEGEMRLNAEVNGKIINKGMVVINHSHIPVQTLFPDSKAKLIRLDTKKVAVNIGYIMGSGDEIPEYLEQLGYNITQLNKNYFNNGKLSSFDAVITGVRAYNTQDELALENKKLLEYVKEGGTLIVQYNVSRGLTTEDIGPYSFELSRERVTDETAAVKFLKKDHQILNFPNIITQDDFNNWIQERGLYFAGKWDPKYETILSTQDPGESPLDGGLLFTRYGKGVFIYTGFSWFRQIPAGIPGAYRIFVNLISAGKYKNPEINKEVGSINKSP